MYRLEVGEESASGVDISPKLQSVNGRATYVNVYGTNQVACFAFIATMLRIHA